MSKHAISPTRLAWYRFRANSVAMVSGVILITIIVACVAAPLLTGQNPDTQHPWIGAQPPGISHPAVPSHIQLSQGQALDPVLGDAAVTASTLSWVVGESTFTEVRVSLRRGKVASIARYPGPELVDHIAVAEREIVIIDSRGSEQTRLVNDDIQLNTEPPAGLFPAGERVVIMRLREPAVDVRYQATVDAGVVSDLQREGESIATMHVRGEQVVSCRFDDHPAEVFHIFGTDALGRDVFARVLYGGRISLLVGVVATLVSLIIGVLYGAISGYRGGRVDRAMMGGVDVLYALPFMFLVILLLTLFGRSLLLLFVALGAVQWLTMARIVRSQVLSLAGSEFIAAARLSGASGWRIVWRHLIPNCAGPVIVYATLTVPAVILEESFLAFLGLGVGFADSDVESWGSLVHAGSLATNHPWLLFVPATAMALTLLTLNIVGDGVRDALDPKLEGR